jgi:hypothetical protein
MSYRGLGIDWGKIKPKTTPCGSSGVKFDKPWTDGKGRVIGCNDDRLFNVHNTGKVEEFSQKEVDSALRAGSLVVTMESSAYNPKVDDGVSDVLFYGGIAGALALVGLGLWYSYR